MNVNQITDQIIDNYLDLRSQGRSHEETYDVIVLQGYSKELVDLCLIEAFEFSDAMQNEIIGMARSGLTPQEVVQVLVDEGHSEALIRAYMEPFLEREES
jgi:hypothetical protein